MMELKSAASVPEATPFLCRGAVAYLSDVSRCDSRGFPHISSMVARIASSVLSRTIS